MLNDNLGTIVDCQLLILDMVNRDKLDAIDGQLAVEKLSERFKGASWMLSKTLTDPSVNLAGEYV